MNPTSTQQATSRQLTAADLAGIAINELWYDCQDLLQQLHISKRTLQNWRNAGKIPFSRIGSKIWYRKADVLELLDRINERR